MPEPELLLDQLVNRQSEFPVRLEVCVIQQWLWYMAQSLLYYTHFQPHRKFRLSVNQLIQKQFRFRHKNCLI